MKTITHTSGKTWSESTTSVVREVPILKDFPAARGAAGAVSLQTTLRTGSKGTFTYTVYLFKKFGGDPEYWDDRGDYLYQYPGSHYHYLVEGYISEVLASGTFTDALASGNNVITKALTLTDLGKQVENWDGDVYLGVVSDSGTTLYWGNGITSTVILSYNNGAIKYATDGGFVNCEVFYATGGSWKQVQPLVASGGAFKEVGE